MAFSIMANILGLGARKPVIGEFANNTGADQPGHPCRLISTFVIRVLESIISKLATSEISIVLLVLVCRKTSKTGFVTTSPIYSECSRVD